MAEIKQYTSDEKKKIAKGLLSVVPGTPASTVNDVDATSAEGVDSFISASKKDIDANIRPKKKSRGFLDMLAGKPEEEDKPGAKDKLKEYAIRAIKGELKNSDEILSLKAGLAVTGFNTSFNNDLSADMASLPKFLEQLNKGMTLNGIFSANAEAVQQQNKVEADNAAKAAADAKSQGDMYTKYSAGLVYAGYLKPEDAGNPSKSAQALSELIANTMPPGRQADELKSMFANINTMEPNQKALDYIKNHTLSNSTADRLQADLESKDPARIKLAQGYMALNEVKVGGKDVDINGKIYSSEFVDAATSLVRQDIKMPVGTGPNGRPNLQELYGLTAGGQLHLPKGALEALSKGDQEAASRYPAAKDAKPGDTTREGFIAARLINDNPSKYEALLAAENAQRKNLNLNVTVELPVTKVDAGISADKEREVANNPLGTKAVDSITAVSEIANGAVSKTQSGTLQYNDADKALSDFTKYMKDHAEGSKVTLSDALKAVHYASVDSKTAIIAGAFGSTDLQTLDIYARRLPEQLGYDAKHKFDLNNPVELQAVLTGVVAYTNRDALGKGSELVANLKDKKPDYMASIERVAKGKPEEAPAVKDPEGVPVAKNDEKKVSFLNEDFNTAAPGILNVGIPKDLDAKNSNWKPAGFNIG